MTIKDLIKKLKKREAEGYGDKPIFVEDGQELFHIHSIQKNTMPDVEPDYLFIMAGSEKRSK